jgi:sugar lactone lactonase YvrE
MIRKSLFVPLCLLLLLVAYLLLAPVPIHPLPWHAPHDAGYSGPHLPNTRLTDLHLVSLGGGAGPEHVALGPDGKLYVAVDGGKIIRMQADGSVPEVWANSGGRVLGFDFDAAGRLIAADAMRGLLAIDSGPERTITVLADHVQDHGQSDPIRYADAVVVAKNGKIYLSDASRHFGAKQFGGTFNASVLDIVEHDPTGRILEYDPATRQLRVVLHGLSFANGLALSADESALFVAETGAYRVWKIDPAARDLNAAAIAAAADAGDASQSTPQARILLANLPGYPDNLMRGMHGRIWLGLAKPRGAALDNMAEIPFLRDITMRLPKVLWPVPPAYGHVIAFDEEGKMAADLQDPSGHYPETTGVLETADRLYIQSLHAQALGWRDKSGLNLP